MNLSGVDFSKFLSGAYKTLNLANQIIPLYQQISPMVKNARNSFSVISKSNLLKKDNVKKSVNLNNNQIVQKKELSLNNPVFFQ